MAGQPGIVPYRFDRAILVRVNNCHSDYPLVTGRKSIIAGLLGRRIALFLTRHEKVSRLASTTNANLPLRLIYIKLH